MYAPFKVQVQYNNILDVLKSISNLINDYTQKQLIVFCIGDNNNERRQNRRPRFRPVSDALSAVSADVTSHGDPGRLSFFDCAAQ